MTCYVLNKPVAEVAQSVEQGTENPRVGGSIPPLGTKIMRKTYLGKSFLFYLIMIINMF